jgi:hypothetical protein
MFMLCLCLLFGSQTCLEAVVGRALFARALFARALFDVAGLRGEKPAVGLGQCGQDPGLLSPLEDGWLLGPGGVHSICESTLGM